MRNIKVERLVDAVVDDFNCYTAYIRQARQMHNGTTEDFARQKAMVRELLNYHDRQESIVWALREVLQMDEEQYKRLYVVARAVERWRRKTNYARLLPEQTQRQIEEFIFGR